MPGVAQGAIQAGQYVGDGDPDGGCRASRTRRSGTGTRATSRSSAGWPGSRTSAGSGRSGGRAGSRAWLLWLGIHIFYLIGFANRIVVIVRWAWSFLTHGRGSRLITGSPLLPPIDEPEPPAWEEPDEPGAAPAEATSRSRRGDPAG